MSSVIPIKSGALPIHKTRDYAKEDLQIKEVAKSYEKIFLNKMLKSMRDTVPKSDFIKKSFGEQMYSEQLDQEYVKVWGKRGGVGLSDIIYTQIKQMVNRSYNIPQPSGPLPIENQKHLPINKGVKPRYEIKTKKTDLGVSFQYNNVSENFEPQEVKSPWSGEVLRNIGKIGNLNYLQIKHADNMISTLGIKGEFENLSVGEKVDAGQKLGWVQGSDKLLTWELKG